MPPAAHPSPNPDASTADRSERSSTSQRGDGTPAAAPAADLPGRRADDPPGGRRQATTDTRTRSERRVDDRRRADRRQGERRIASVPEVSQTQALLASADRLAAFGPVILAIRWSTTMVSIALAANAFVVRDWTLIPWVAAIAANTTIRTVTPVRYVASTRSLINVLIEVAFHLLAVAATGLWHSPLIFSLITSITIAAFARGFGFGLRVGGVVAAAVSLPELITSSWRDEEVILASQWSTVMLLVAVIAGYARRISWEASQQQVLALDRLTRLSDANALLHSLNQVAQQLPASLDRQEVLDSTLQRLDELVAGDRVVVLVAVDDADEWTIDRRRNIKLPGRLTSAELPVAVQRTVEVAEPTRIRRFSPSAPGFHPDSKSALYLPLLARGVLIGVLAIESDRERYFGERDEDVVGAFCEPAALALDNSRQFARLRTVGADEERTRIARDLHDRIGQSLAFLAFELDRILNRDEADPVRELLTELRANLRSVVSEVRETLYDLRTDVGADRDFATVIGDFSARVADRAHLEIDLDCDRSMRLPILQEREMWRIAQEALINVERHADASHVKISWLCSGSTAVLEVADDGRGFPDGHSGRIDSYGILGMRERAASIGASFELISHPGEGTTVRCSLARI